MAGGRTIRLVGANPLRAWPRQVAAGPREKNEDILRGLSPYLQRDEGGERMAEAGGAGGGREGDRAGGKTHGVGWNGSRRRDFLTRSFAGKCQE